MTLQNRLLMLSVFVLYLFCLWHYSVNVPFQDDYGAVLFDLSAILNAHHFHDMIQALFAQHNEHRIMTTRLVEWAQYLVFGQINFKGLILLAGLYRIGIFFLLYQMIKEPRPAFTFLLLIFFFQLSDYECAFWAMAALSAYGVIFFVLLTLFSLYKNLQSSKNIWFILACISAFLASFSNGNGIFLFFPAWLMLFWHQAYRRLGLFILLGLACIGFYFYGYHTPGQVSPSVNPEIAAYVLIFLGNIWRTYLIAMLLGLIAFIIAVRFIRHSLRVKQLKENLFFYYLAFIFITALATAVSRLNLGGLHEAMASRYSIYSIVFLSILLLWQQAHRQALKRSLGAILLAIALVNIVHGIQHQTVRAHELLSYQRQSNGHYSGLAYPDPQTPDTALTLAEKEGFYHLPAK